MRADEVSAKRTIVDASYTSIFWPIGSAGRYRASQEISDGARLECSAFLPDRFSGESSFLEHG